MRKLKVFGRQRRQRDRNIRRKIKFCDKYKITFVIISHDIEAMSQMVNRAIVIHDKEIYIDASIRINKLNFNNIFNIF